MIIFPDQHGTQKEESMTFTTAQHQEESSIYDTIARWIHRSGKARGPLVLAVVLNLGILFFFKYFNFAAEKEKQIWKTL